MTQGRMLRLGLPPLVRYVRERSQGLRRRGRGLAAGALRAANRLADGVRRPPLVRGVLGAAASGRRAVELVWPGRSRSREPAWPVETTSAPSPAPPPPTAGRFTVNARPKTSEPARTETALPRPSGPPPTRESREAIMRKGMPTRSPTGIPPAAASPQPGAAPGARQEPELTPAPKTGEPVGGQTHEAPGPAQVERPPAAKPVVATPAAELKTPEVAPLPSPGARESPTAAEAARPGPAPREATAPAGLVPRAETPGVRMVESPRAPAEPTVVKAVSAPAAAGTAPTGRSGPAPAVSTPAAAIGPGAPAPDVHVAAATDNRAADQAKPVRAEAAPPRAEAVQSHADQAEETGTPGQPAVTTPAAVSSGPAAPLAPGPVAPAEPGRAGTKPVAAPRASEPAPPKPVGLGSRLSSAGTRAARFVRGLLPVPSRSRPPAAAPPASPSAQPAAGPAVEAKAPEPPASAAKPAEVADQPSASSVEAMPPEPPASAGTPVEVVAQPSASSVEAKAAGPPASAGRPAEVVVPPSAATAGREAEATAPAEEALDVSRRPEPPASTPDAPVELGLLSPDNVAATSAPAFGRRPPLPGIVGRRSPVVAPLARKPVELVVARKAARLEPPGVVEGKTTQSAAPPLELHFAAPSVQRAPPSETRTGGAASTAASTSGGPETSGGTPAGPGLGEIADSVYRIIRRRLAAERERTVGRR